MSDDDADIVPIEIDKVRASKAGHAFHEAWAARTALELLPPSTDLSAIISRGFRRARRAEPGNWRGRVADLVRYYGATDVAWAHRVTVVQFKYSIASADTAVRAADLDQLPPSLLRPMHGFGRRMAMTMF